jgi:hypothetical protein
MLDLVYEYRVLLGKCATGVGLSLDEIDAMTRIEAVFAAGEDDRRASDGRRFRREAVSLAAVIRGGALHDAVTVAELTLGGLVCLGAPYATVGAIIDVAIAAPDAHRSYRFKGRVRWVGDDTDDDYRLGVELIGAPVMIRYATAQTTDPGLARLAA